MTVGNLDVTYSTYVTNDTPTTTPYRVTVIVQWPGGAIGERAEQLGHAPEPLLVSRRMCELDHPPVRGAVPAVLLRAGRCAAAALTVTGQLYDFAIDFDALAVTLPGIDRDDAGGADHAAERDDHALGHHVHR